MNTDREHRKDCMAIMAAVSYNPATVTPEKQRQLTEFMVANLGHRDTNYKPTDGYNSNAI